MGVSNAFYLTFTPSAPDETFSLAKGVNPQILHCFCWYSEKSWNRGGKKRHFCDADSENSRRLSVEDSRVHFIAFSPTRFVPTLVWLLQYC